MSGNDNNLNLLRVVAALLVLVSHSFVIVTGDVGREPLRITHGLTFGSIAVDVFFLVSGLLVTRSIVNRNDAIAFVTARALRIWPGLVVSLLLVAYVLGGAVTGLPMTEYLGSAGTFNFVFRGVTMAVTLPALPGVFTNNPFGDAANLSLWTLPAEVRMYAYLLGAWLVTCAAGRLKRKAFMTVIALAFGYYAASHMASHGGTIEWSGARLPFMFFTGALASLFAGRVVMSRLMASAALCLLLVTAAFGGATFFIAYSVTLPYLVLWLAFEPGGTIRLYNKAGDYSYGLYIYAWPVQQAIIFAHPGLSVFAHILLSITATLPLAATSWHLVEKPAMRVGVRLRRRPVPQPQA